MGLRRKGDLYERKKGKEVAGNAVVEESNSFGSIETLGKGTTEDEEERIKTYGVERVRERRPESLEELKKLSNLVEDGGEEGK